MVFGLRGGAGISTARDSIEGKRGIDKMQRNHRTIAEKFIRDQIRIMKKHGASPKLDGEQYRKLVSDTERKFRGLDGSYANSSRISHT